MPRKASKHPTELELQILKLVWREGEVTVRHLRELLAADSRDLAYTSVMTMTGIMTDKGYLRRRREGKGYIYRPAISEEDISRDMMGDLVKRVFDGSARAAMVNLLEMGQIDEEELEDLRRLLDERESRNKGRGQSS